jgi:hypothetical protein
MTIDDFVFAMSTRPTLIKIDVEGSEPQVLRGARGLLRSDDAPALCFEWNPLTLSELDGTSSDVMQELEGYRLYYIDDFESQRRPFGSTLADLSSVDWVCNVFAVPDGDSQTDKWRIAMSDASARLRNLWGRIEMPTVAFGPEVSARSES